MPDTTSTPGPNNSNVEPGKHSHEINTPDEAAPELRDRFNELSTVLIDEVLKLRRDEKYEERYITEQPELGDNLGSFEGNRAKSKFVEDNGNSDEIFQAFTDGGESIAYLPRQRYTTELIKTDEYSGSAALILRSPIGEYGPEFAQASVEAASRLLADMYMVFPLVEERFNTAEGEFADLVSTFTVQGIRAASNDDIPVEQRWRGLFTEGVGLILNAMGLLMPKKIGGFDDPVELFDDINSSGMFNKLASALVFAQLAEHLQFPIHPYPLPAMEQSQARSGKWSFTKEWRGIFAKTHRERAMKIQERREKIKAGELKEEPVETRTETGRGCPVAMASPDGTPSSISQLGDLYSLYLHEEYDKLKKRSQ